MNETIPLTRGRLSLVDPVTTEEILRVEVEECEPLDDVVSVFHGKQLIAIYKEKQCNLQVQEK